MNKDINDFFWLFGVFIEEASIKFSSKSIKKWRSYVVFGGSPFLARSLAVVRILSKVTRVDAVAVCIKVL